MSHRKQKARSRVRRWIAPVLVLCVAVAAGCDGGPGRTSLPADVNLRTCTHLRTFDFLAVLEVLDNVVAAVEDAAAAPGLDVMLLPAGTDAFDFVADLDVDGDGTFDLTLSGTITLSEDFTGGVPPGATATVDWTLDIGGGMTTGSGSLALAFPGDDTVEITGTGTVTDQSGNCDAEFTIDNTAPLTVGPLSEDVAGQVGLGLLSSGTEVMTSEIVFPDCNARILFTNVTADGQGTDSFQVYEDLQPDGTLDIVVAGLWDGTWDLSYDCEGELGGATLTIIHDVGDSTIQVRDVDDDPSFPVLDYTATLDAAGDATTFTISYRVGAIVITETFTFTLNADGCTFTKTSTWTADDGSSGTCTGTATWIG